MGGGVGGFGTSVNSYEIEISPIQTGDYETEEILDKTLDVLDDTQHNYNVVEETDDELKILLENSRVDEASEDSEFPRIEYRENEIRFIDKKGVLRASLCYIHRELEGKLEAT